MTKWEALLHYRTEVARLAATLLAGSPAFGDSQPRAAVASAVEILNESGVEDPSEGDGGVMMRLVKEHSALHEAHEKIAKASLEKLEAGT